MSKTFHIAVLPGDGIGPDVTAEAIKVLQKTASHFSEVQLDFAEYSVGAVEYLKNGDPLPEKAFDACRQADAVLLGAMGLPDVRWPDGKEMTPQVDLRERLELYAGMRPIYLNHELDSPLKGFKAGDIDLVIVRESTEGLFSGRLSKRTEGTEEVHDVMRITRHGSERVIRAAFREAEKRRNHVTLIDKANVLPSMVYFRSIFDEIAQEFPNLKADHVYVDATALYLVKDPRRFDVMVTENMFGDILSDLAAGIIGGMGMAPSADVGDTCAVFQPSHGSAPDIAGKGVANPVATILSAAMMLEWLGHEETVRGAASINRAVRTALENPKNRTPDLGGSITTFEMGELIAAAVTP